MWKEKIRLTDPWGTLKEKITRSQHACQQWRKTTIDPTKLPIGQKTKVLGDLQGEGDGSDMEEIHQLQGEVNKLIELEELKWQQMAQQAW